MATSSKDPRDWCEVCLGSGLPSSGAPCICGGAGTSSEEKVGLRREILRCRDKITALEAALDWALPAVFEHYTEGEAPKVPGAYEELQKARDRIGVELERMKKEQGS